MLRLPIFRTRWSWRSLKRVRVGLCGDDAGASLPTPPCEVRAATKLSEQRPRVTTIPLFLRERESNAMHLFMTEADQGETQ